MIVLIKKSMAILGVALLCGITTLPVQVHAVEQEQQRVGKNTEFEDVLPTDWFYNSVKYMIGKGSVSGYGNDMFLPNNNVTRAEFASILFNTVMPKGQLADKVQREALKEGIDYEKELEKINPTYWGNKVIAISEYYGMIDVEHSMADWSKEITRAEMAQLAVQTAEKVNGESLTVAPDIKERIADYNIVRLIPQYEEIAKAYTAGIIAGDNNGVFNPLGTATRAEACVVVRNLVDISARKPISSSESLSESSEGLEDSGKKGL